MVEERVNLPISPLCLILLLLSASNPALEVAAELKRLNRDTKKNGSSYFGVSMVCTGLQSCEQDS